MKSACVVLFICGVCAQGRIHQIEYAMEAVKQGSATVGLKSRSHAVLVALKVLSQVHHMLDPSNRLSGLGEL